MDRLENASTEIKMPLILVVDDEDSICTSLSSVLRDESYDTLSAHDGQAALEAVKKHNPDLVFLDIWMPGWDGVETLEKIKQVSPDTEVIMISGHATISNALEATKRGAFDFIEKPFDIESVIFSASRALEKKRNKHKEINLSGDDSGKLGLLNHRGVLSTGWKGKNLGQRTIAKSTILYGQCLHSGQKSGLVLEPLPINSGIHFSKIGETQTIPAFVDYVDTTAFATALSSNRATVSTIEHLMAVLHAYRITNLLVKCNDEVPIFDGSGSTICNRLDEIGIVEQGGQWFELAVQEKIELNFSEAKMGESLCLEPSAEDGLTIVYELIYPAPVGRLLFEFKLNGKDTFKSEIAPARTFGFMKDIEKLQKAGLAAGGRLNNFILIGEDKVINTELRFPEELARHKILDAIGDLFLIGRPLQGKLRARMTGHSDNYKLVQELQHHIG
ncbi:MAG: UDP-3-O-[3-hydroxymyristoyl] N-acetylglucosamine deacetylase [Deltaproteobacteria bacterium]|nr:UDP-3-O-[3-hydroxymyristoyl] N-acetylglucosamine deacetylase [Deltaproteobacteria bacterium]